MTSNLKQDIIITQLLNCPFQPNLYEPDRTGGWRIDRDTNSQGGFESIDWGIDTEQLDRTKNWLN